MTGMLLISNQGHATFLGQLPSLYPAPSGSGGVTIGTAYNYLDFRPTTVPVNDHNLLNAGYLASYNQQPGTFPPALNWNGNSTISITSMPDLNDISTWTWTEEIFGSGTSLQVTPAPEPATISLGALAAMVGLAFRFCKSRKPAI